MHVDIVLKPGNTIQTNKNNMSYRVIIIIVISGDFFKHPE